MVHIEKRQGCFCEIHPNEEATSLFRVVFGRKIRRRFKVYKEAYQYLTGLRYEKAYNKLDPEDHIFSNPKGFANMARNYVKYKEAQGLTEMNNIRRYMKNASAFFGDKNVKGIKKADIVEFLDSLTKTIKDAGGEPIQVPMSDKSKELHKDQLFNFYHDFLYDHLEKLGIHELPRFPKVDVDMGYRTLIDIDDRELVMERLKKDTMDNPKIWLGVDLLCSYGRIRPIDLRRLTEEDIDLKYGFITFWRPSKRKKKSIKKPVGIKLLDFHIKEFKRLKALDPGFGKTLFFRHPKDASYYPGRPFGRDTFYNAWIKAARSVGFYDVDLYGGTRHSSTTAIGKVMGKKKARDFSGHDTNKAFDRYCQIGDQDDYIVSQMMAKMRGEVIELRKAEGDN